MKNKTVTTKGKLADGSAVAVTSNVQVPETLKELKELAADALGTTDNAAIESHLIDLLVCWCVAHIYQSQVRSKLKTASPSLTNDQLTELVNDIKFRLPRPASVAKSDKITLKKSQLTTEQVEKLRELGIL